uniref:Ion_trans_2 domain-containing protein n=1 Tax=Elaeophora elaphi TaxID=1147741 RepID=A0A0R3S4U9_9BILA
VLRKEKNYSDETVTHIESCWKSDIDEREEWSYLTSTLYGFGIMTTLGCRCYNRIQPKTKAGRLFTIIYGLFGIPVTMIVIAVTGRHLNTFAANWKRKVDFLNGLYYNFLCLTAIDFGQLIPRRSGLLPVTFAYVCVGLALAAIAIDDGAKYVRKLQHLGETIKNVASTKIWFGGKTTNLRDILYAVGKKCGIEPSVIDEIDLDEVIEEAIAQNVSLNLSFFKKAKCFHKTIFKLLII